MVDYKEIFQANTPQELTEASLSRVWQHLGEGRSWGLVSSYRPHLSKEENQQRVEELKSDLKKERLGYFPLKGMWKDKDSGEVYSEPSFFVPEISRDQIVKLGRKYDQDAVLYGESDKESDEASILIIGQSNNVLDNLGPNKSETLRVKNVGDVYSKLQGHDFDFAESKSFGLVSKPQSFSEALVRKANRGTLINIIDDFISSS